MVTSINTDENCWYSIVPIGPIVPSVVEDANACTAAHSDLDKWWQW
jgi:hypothetical protein